MTPKYSNPFTVYATAFFIGISSLCRAESEEVEVGTRPLSQEVLEKILKQEEQCPACPEGEKTCTFNAWSGEWAPTSPTTFYEILDFETDGNLIRITDGSQWKVAPNNKMSGWRTGQGITIEVDNWSWGYLTSSSKQYVYRLVNQVTGTSVEALLYKGSNVQSPYYRQVEGLLKNSLQVSLNDHSSWAVMTSDSLLYNEWLVNDTIIIGSVRKGWFDCCNAYNYILINVDSNHFVRAKKL